MLGVAISVYDKFEELRLLLDILRENFRTRFVIAVCSNSDAAESELRSAPIDMLVQGEAIHFSPQLDWRLQGRPNLVCRVCDTIRRSSLAAMELGADRVVHLHSDAWPLREECLLGLFERVRDSGKVFAARGLGFGFYGNDAPLGNFDDMFFCFDSAAMRRCGFFDFEPLEMLPHKLSIHGILATLALAKVGLSRFDHYNDQTRMEMWPGRRKPLPVLPAFPSHHDLDEGFLHVHRQAFPDRLGERLQAHYLAAHGLTRGTVIPEFTERWKMDERELIDRLERLHADAERKMRSLGLDPREFGGDYTKMLRLWSGYPAWKRPLVGLYRRSRGAAKRLLRGRPAPRRYGHHDSLWPKPLDQHYRDTIDRSHYPRTSFWFDPPPS